jgi:hypothetical protein
MLGLSYRMTQFQSAIVEERVLRGYIASSL